MDTPTNDAPGEKPDAAVTPEAGVKPQDTGDTLSQFDGIADEDIYAMLEAAEKAEIDGPDNTPEAPEAPKAEAPEPEQQQTPEEEAKAEEPKQEEPKTEDGEPNAPSRIRLKGLTPEARIETAAAVNLINEGKAADLAEALAILRKDNKPEKQPEPEAREEENPAQAREEKTEESQAPLTRASEIKSRIDQLREDRDEADEAFDRAEVRRITREIEDLQLDLIRAERVEEQQQAQARSYGEAYEAACERVEQKYPDTGDENSVFSRLLDDKVAGAKARQDPALSDPAFIERFADEVAGILGTTRQAPEGKQSPAPKAAPVANGRDVAPGHQSAGRISSAEAARQFDRMSDEEAYAVLEKAESLSRGF